MGRWTEGDAPRAGDGDAEPKPALVCPCHYSTFDPATGGTVIFGPAGRKLPQTSRSWSPLPVDEALAGLATDPRITLTR